MWSRGSRILFCLQRKNLSSKLSEVRALIGLLKILIIIHRIPKRFEVDWGIYNGWYTQFFPPFLQTWKSNVIAILIAILQHKEMGQMEECLTNFMIISMDRCKLVGNKTMKNLSTSNSAKSWVLCFGMPAVSFEW